MVTHYDDDHIRGMSSIVEHCKNAQFFTSTIFLEGEFLDLVELYGNKTMTESSGLDEFKKTIHILNETSRGINLINEKKFLKRDISNNLEIMGLSPSDQAIVVSLIQLSKLMPLSDKPHGQPKKRFIEIKPNISSSVIYFRIGNNSILLGSDLENTTDKQIGWDRIIHVYSEMNLDKCMIFKVPHHGSSNANNDRVWTEILEDDHVSLTTPWGLGGKYVPSNSDMKRISKFSKNSYISSLPKFRKYKHEDAAVDRTVNEAEVKLKRINTEGFIRVRFDKNDNNIKEVKCYGEAREIRHLLN